MIASSLDDLYVYQVDIIQCSWRINFSNSFCIQSHLFINISSLSLSKILLSFNLNRSINSIFHFIFRFVSIRRRTFQLHFLFILQISIETNNLFFIYQNISNFRWNSCQHDWMTIHLNNNYHDVSFSFEQLRNSHVIVFFSIRNLLNKTWKFQLVFFLVSNIILDFSIEHQFSYSLSIVHCIYLYHFDWIRIANHSYDLWDIRFHWYDWMNLFLKYINKIYRQQHCNY